VNPRQLFVGAKVGAQSGAQCEKEDLCSFTLESQYNKTNEILASKFWLSTGTDNIEGTPSAYLSDHVVVRAHGTILVVSNCHCLQCIGQRADILRDEKSDRYLDHLQGGQVGMQRMAEPRQLNSHSYSVVAERVRNERKSVLEYARKRQYTDLDKRAALHAHVGFEEWPNRRRDLEKPVIKCAKKEHDRRCAGTPGRGIGDNHILVDVSIAVDGALPGAIGAKNNKVKMKAE
jgi:hypothetical protein